MKERKYGKERKRWEMWEENLLLDIVHGKLEGTQDIKSVLINDSKIWTREYAWDKVLDIFIENNVVGLDHQQIRRKYNDLKSKKKRRFADIESFDDGSQNHINRDTSYDHNYIPESNTNEEKRHRIEPCGAPEGSNVTAIYVPVVDAKLEASASRPTRILSSGGTRTSATTTKGSQARYIQSLKPTAPSSNTSIGLGPAHWEEKYFKEKINWMNSINSMKLEVLEYQREYWKRKVENMNNPGSSSPTPSLQQEPTSPDNEDDEL